VNVARDVALGRRVRLSAFVNLYGCEIGDNSRPGAFVEIQRGARVGARCKISSHTFICSGIDIEDGVFIGHGVVFINDRYPRATNEDGLPQREADWRMERTVARENASIGSGAIVMCGVEVGARAIVGAGAVVTGDVPPDTVVAGCPARLIRTIALRRSARDRGPNGSNAVTQGSLAQGRRGPAEGPDANQDG
jgi:acetyltransferase-like isoleucine patch superfamily enzyme